MDSSDPPRPWPVLESGHGPDLRIFRPRWDLVENPRNGHQLKALILETPAWATVVARDEAGRFLMVQQWRFGSRALSLEVPAGVVHAGEPPLAAARRELLEETGCVAERWSSLGSVAPNPAVHDNRCHQFLAEGVRQVQDPTLDQGEDLRRLWLEEAEVVAAVREGRIDHALAVTALGRVLDLRVTPAPAEH